MSTTRELGVKKRLVTLLSPKSVLDIGCGCGEFIGDWGLLGVQEVRGLDKDPISARAEAFCFEYDFTSSYLVPDVKKQQARFDLGWCMNVVGFIEQAHLPKLINTFSWCKVVAMNPHPGTRDDWEQVLYPWFVRDEELTEDARRYAKDAGKEMLVFRQSL